MVQRENADNSSGTGMGSGTPMALLEQGLMVMDWAEMGSWAMGRVGGNPGEAGQGWSGLEKP